MRTLHASIELFQKNADMVPGTRQFDKELADRVTKFAKPYEVRVEGNRLERIGRPQDAARAAGAPTGHAAIEVHRHETPPGAAGIGRLHIGHNPVEDSGVPALRLRDGRLDAGASGARLDCPALSTR